MTEGTKILWEQEYLNKWKSHAYLDDGSYEGLCGSEVADFMEPPSSVIADFIEGRNPPEEKKCKRCLKILAQKGG